VKFKIDENLPQEVAQILCDHGHHAVSVFNQTLSGEKDPTLFEVCQDERRVLVNLDLGFANIQAYPPGASAGIVAWGQGGTRQRFDRHGMLRNRG
jgi:predicted nuclease of predicted toxin-antitoxin system